MADIATAKSAINVSSVSPDLRAKAVPIIFVG